MARIRIYIARHLCTAPRPQKEADALAAAGHTVSIHGISYQKTFAERDRAIASGRDWTWEPVVDFTSAHRRWAWFVTRLRHRLARELFATTGWRTANVWGYANTALAAHALHSEADLTIAHAEGPLWFARKLLRGGARVGADFEDWFSQDLTPAQRRGRPVATLAALEGDLLRRTRYTFTTSRALADAMARHFDAPPPCVIYNTFPAGPEPALPSALRAPVKLHWFSLVIGPERGLETLFAALPFVRGEWELHLRGEIASDYRSRLLGSVPPQLAQRVNFHPTIPSSELPAALAEYDVGLALEVSSIPSRNLTLTNKFFHYLQAGLAVVASDTAGHREGIAQAPGAGILFPAGDAAALANAISHWTTDPSHLLQSRRAARHAFVSRLSHEHQATRYAERAALALADPC